MARITVEDCLVQIPNRFQLVLAATYRARMLSQGHAPKIETKNKPGVTALREIAAGEVPDVAALAETFRSDWPCLLLERPCGAVFHCTPRWSMTAACQMPSISDKFA